jgi:glucan phosphoethanolaminetransferase (alkaline phosphatase superfamily)
MGESESNMHVGTFGYERNTSPFLTEMLGKPGEAIVKEAYCAGVMTAVSLPTLFNAIPRPNGMEQINRGDTNLFRLAKNQGYKTYWLTAQPESEMNIISMIGRRWLEVVTYPSDFGRKRTEAAPDTTLLEQFDRLPLKGSNFIVLHQRGSHVPYGSLLKPEEKVFGKGNNVDEYDNTILATDRLIKDVYERLKKSKENWILIYTSDHGQNVTKTVANQGTNVAANYAVPLFIAASSPKVLEEAQGDFHRCTRSTHYQLSSFVIRLLGYKFEMPDCNSSVVNGRLLTGDDGYIVVRNGEGQRVQRPK